MAPKDREILTRFILGSSPDEALARSSFSVLHDYFRITERWEYDLVVIETEITDGFNVPISFATGRKVESVTNIRLSSVQPDFRKLLENNKPGYLVSRKTWIRALRSLSKDLRGELWKHMMQGGLDTLPHILCLRLSDSNLKGASLVIARSIMRVLFCYLACILRGDKEGAIRYAPIAYLLPKVIPLGFSKDDPLNYIIAVG